MKNKFIRQVISVVLILVCLLSAIPISTAAAETDTPKSISDIDLDQYGDVITNEELGINISSTGLITKTRLQEIVNGTRTSTWSRTRAATASVVLDECRDNNGTIIKSVIATAFRPKDKVQYRFSIDGATAYCIEPGTGINGGDKLNTNASEVWNSLTQNQQLAINAVLCYGLEGNAATVTAGAVNEDEAYVATQVLIWEITKGERSSVAPFALKSGKSGFLNSFCAGGKNPNIKTAYNRIVEGMSKFWSVPSMANRTQSAAPTYTLKATYSEGEWITSTIKMNDSNKVLADYSLAGEYNVGNATVVIKQSGNTITMTCKDIKTGSEPKEVTISAPKTGVPTTNEGVLVAYGSSTAQDIVIGGSIDPPNAFFKVKVVTGLPTRDGRIQKSCWTVNESQDDTTEEGEGSLSTAENLEGWYFYVEASPLFKSSYGVDNFILGPTDTAGFTQTLSEYIIENIDEDLTYDVPTGMYNFYELGKLKEGATGKDLVNDYYFPDNWTPERGSYAEGTPSGNIFFGGGSIKNLNVIGHVVNIFKIPFRFLKVNESGGTLANFYFTATNHDTGDIYLFRSTKTGYAHIINPSDLYKINDDGSYDNYLPEGTYTIHELGNLKSGAVIGSTDYENDYALPAYFDTPTDAEVEISAAAYKNAQESGAEAIECTITNTVSSYIAIQKKDADTGEAIKGAVYGIYFEKECYTLLETLTTDANGYARTEDKYAKGTYFVQEITAPTYYEKDDTVYTVKVTPTTNVDNVVKIDVTDVLIPAYIQIHKIDEETKTSLAGAVFGMYSDKACTKRLETLTTDKNGYTKTVKAYRPGTYYFKEITAPSGYVLNTEVFACTISKNKEPGVVINIERNNSIYKTYVALEKKDADTGELLAGAVYGLYSDKACTKRLETLTTDANGYAKSKEKYRPGTMYFKEITPPENYESNDEVIPVTITTTQAKNGTVVKVTATDEKIGVKIIVIKYDPDINANGKRLDGAVIGIYADKACKQLLEELDPTDASKNGQATSKNYYKIGTTVYLKEHKAPEGYQKRTDVVTLEITSEFVDHCATTTTSDMILPANGVPYVYHRYYNVANKSNIAIRKTDSKTGKLLANAEFWLCNTSSCSFSYYGSLTTDKNGYAKSTSLFNPGQTVWIKEVSAPDGYIKDNTIYKVTIPLSNESENVVLIEVENDPIITTTITISKTCTQTKLPVANALYRLYRTNVTNSDGAISGAALSTAQTDANGIATFNVTAVPGTVYYIQEWQMGVPVGYNWNKQIYTVTVTENMDVVPVTNNIKTGSVYLTKTDSKGNVMPGVTFEMYTKDGELVTFGNYGASTYYYSKTGSKSTITIPNTSTGQVAITGMPLGEYYFVETSTLDGYMPYYGKIPFTVKLASSSSTAAETLRINVPNHLPVLWSTGGIGRSPFYTSALIAFALSAVLLAFPIIKQAKKHEKSH